MFDFIDNAKANVVAANTRTAQMESKMNRPINPGLGTAPAPSPQPRLDPMSNINAQREQPVRQAPSRTDMDGYVGFLKKADIAKDYMSANQAVPGAIGRSINRTKD